MIDTQNINRLVHEKVMGASWYTNALSQNYRCQWLLLPEEAAMRLTLIPAKGDEETIADDIPDYCGSMNEAWKIVQKMEAQGYGVTLRTPIGSSMYYWCSISMPLEKLKELDISTPLAFNQDSMPIAICLASLGTLG